MVINLHKTNPKPQNVAIKSINQFSEYKMLFACTPQSDNQDITLITKLCLKQCITLAY